MAQIELHLICRWRPICNLHFSHVYVQESHPLGISLMNQNMINVFQTPGFVCPIEELQKSSQNEIHYPKKY